MRLVSTRWRAPMWILALATLLGGVVPASAQRDTRILRTPDNEGRVMVWRNSQAMDEAMTLIANGVHETNPRLLFPLISCAVPTGTRAVRLSGGVWASTEVLVVEGPHSGCRGVVPKELATER